MRRQNDVQEPLVDFCLALEDHRRTEEGRVRSAEELLDWLFRYDQQAARDLIFVRIPRNERGPVLTAWGIRGAKAALRDDDDKVREVVHDALVAGDLDAPSFEEGITSRLLIRWAPLTEWWGFWRAGKLTNPIVQKALSLARERGLFDDAWLLGALSARSGRLQGTDAISDWLTKDALVGWIRALATSKDASPKGVVAALGWDVLLAKAPADSLLSLLDALAKHLALLPATIAPAPAEDAANAENAEVEADGSNAAKTSAPDALEAVAHAAAEPGANPDAEPPTVQPSGAVAPDADATPAAAEPPNVTADAESAEASASPGDKDPPTARHDSVPDRDEVATQDAPKAPAALPGVLVSASSAPAAPAVPLPGVAIAGAPPPPPPLPTDASAAAIPVDDDLEAFDDIDVMPDSAEAGARSRPQRDTGLPVAIPESPAVDAKDQGWEGDDEPAESDRLLQARTAVMASLGAIDAKPTDASYTDSSTRPSALTWGEAGAPRNTPTPTDEITLGQGPKPRRDPDAPQGPAADGAPQKAARLNAVPPRIPRPSK